MGTLMGCISQGPTQVYASTSSFNKPQMKVVQGTIKDNDQC
jgi:hypothetical protein